MRKIPLFIVIPLLFLSWRKSNNAPSLIGYFIGVNGVPGGDTNETLFSIDVNNGKIINNYQGSIQVGSLSLNGGVWDAYDHIHNLYYL